jgi:hypothetical protein
VLASASGVLAGCNIVAPAYAIASGPAKKPAEFILEDRPTLVFVDDRSNVMSRRNLRRQIADRISEDLMVHHAVTQTISPRDGMAVANEETHGKPMPIDAIGRAVGAEQVIYIEMQAFALSADGTTPMPKARCAVKVIDVANRMKLFPGEFGDDARMIDVAAGPVSTQLYQSTATLRQVEDILADKVGTELATLFYESSPREPGKNLNPR